MVLYWWNTTESTEYKKDENKINFKSQSDDNEKNNSENDNKKSHQTETIRDSWFRNFTRKKPEKVDIGVGDDVINKKFERNTLLKFLFQKNKTNDSPNFSKNPERLDKFVSSLQREVVVVQKEIIASSIASVLSTLISHPFDVIKLNFQSARHARRIQPSFRGRKRIIYVVRHILMTKGMRRFYKGHLISQRVSLFHTISMFWTYHQVNEYLKNIDQLKEHPNLVTFVSGFVSASIPVMALYPIATLRERRYTKRQLLKTCGPIVAASLNREIQHFRPIFRGCLSLFLHMGTQYGLRFFFYEKIREEMILKLATREKATSTNPIVSSVDTINQLSNGQLLLAGGISAILGDLLSHPLDVIHLRICMPVLIRQQYHFEHTCRRICQCVIMILKKEGIFAFYSGLISSMLKSTVNTAVQFAIYENVQIWLQSLFPT